MFKVNVLQSFHTWGRLFLVALFFVTLAASLFWLDYFRTYQADATLLVIGKSQTTQTNQVVGNFAELSKNLSFYERVLERNDFLDDDFEGYALDKRKSLWNEMARVKRTEDSGVLLVSIQKERAEQAKLFAEETIQELFSLAGFYYNIKTDIDVRLVDGPIVKTVLRDPFLYVGASIGTGILVTSLFFWILSVTPFFFRSGESMRKGEYQESLSFSDRELSEKTRREFTIGESVPFIDPRKFIPTRPTSLSFENFNQEEVLHNNTDTKREEEQEKTVAFEETFPRYVQSAAPKSQAPANLPSAQEVALFSVTATEADLPFTFEERHYEDVAPLDQRAEEEVVDPKTIEPTLEEYKRRLNELLSGGR